MRGGVCDGDARTFRDFSALVGGFLASLVLMLCSAGTAAAQTKNVRIMLDWIIQGTHAPFFVAQEQGYFKAAGVAVDTIDAGKGATNVAVSVAGGVYHFGWVDLPSMIRFNAQNPAAPLIAVYMSFDASPLAVITRKDAGIRKPSDLDGRKIAGGPGTAVHDTVSILLKAANAENVKINWVAVQPQLFGPMLKRGEVDGTGGFTNSNIPAALELGFTLDELFVLKYSDFGADMYGLALVTTKKFADENPAAVRGVVKALNQGTKDTIASPQKAPDLLKSRDP
jgi:NitT/TauT family transport system substrate-binding protein